jgi:RHS repeat-associated protein
MVYLMRSFFIVFLSLLLLGASFVPLAASAQQYSLEDLGDIVLPEGVDVSSLEIPSGDSFLSGDVRIVPVNPGSGHDSDAEFEVVYGASEEGAPSGLSTISSLSQPSSVAAESFDQLEIQEPFAASSHPAVNESNGSLSFPYPIDLPGGRNGITPDLSLQYNSNINSALSIVGYGWDLPVPYIERYTGYGIEKTYSVSDVFISSEHGEILQIPLTASYVPRVSGSDHIKYSINGSQVWEYTNINGVVYRYGAHFSDRLHKPGNPQNTFRWYLSSIESPAGEKIVYSYEQDSTSNQTLLKQIAYMYSSNTPGVTVDFSYKNNPQYYYSYQTMFRVDAGNLLDTIKVTVVGEEITEYVLNRETPQFNKQQVLSGVTKTSLRDESLSETTSFDYYDEFDGFHPSNTQAYIPADEDDFLYPYFLNGFSSGNIIDMDRDGVGEVITHTSDGTALWDLQEDGLWSKKLLPNYPKYAPWHYYIGNQQLQPIPHGFGTFIDSDGDGGMEYNIIRSLGTPYHSQSQIHEHRGRYEYNGDDFEMVEEYAADQWQFFDHWNVPDTKDSVHKYGASTSILDLNKDDLPDVFYIFPSLYDDARHGGGPGSYALKLSDGNGNFLDEETSPPLQDLNGTKVYIGDQSQSYEWDKRYTGFWNYHTKFQDINGDGFSDLVRKGVWLYNPDLPGWEKSGYPDLPSQARSLDAAQSQFIDVNEDGLVDLVSWSKVYLNTGTSWVLDDSFAIHQLLRDEIINGSAYGGGSLVATVDINGDGLLDVIRSSISTSQYQGDVQYYISNGFGWDQYSHEEIATITRDIGLSYPSYVYPTGGASKIYDYDGDGLAEWIYLNDDGDPSLYNAGDGSLRLKQVVNPYGLETSITYKQEGLKGAAWLGQPNTMMVVDEVVSASSGNELSRTQYDYEHGFRYRESRNQEKRFAGFKKTSAHSLDKNGGIIKTQSTYYHQGDESNESLGEYGDAEEKIGRVYRSETTGGGVSSTTFTEWEVVESSTGIGDYVVPFITLATTSSSGVEVSSASQFSYANGLLESETNLGLVDADNDGSFTDIGADSRTTTYEYAESSDGMIILPSEVTVTDDEGNVIGHSRTYYDGESLGEIGGNALVTKEEVQISDNDWRDSTYTHDTYGNILTATDAVGETTSITYDTHGLYPISTTNPLGHTTETIYDVATGNLLQSINPNGSKTSSTYDGLGRVTATFGDNTEGVHLQLIESEYVLDQSPIHVITIAYTDAGSATSYSYMDGFGRTIQTKADNRLGGYVTTSQVYDAYGRKVLTTLGYESGDSSYTQDSQPEGRTIIAEYDALDRITSTTDATGTVTTTYDGLTTTTTDQTGVSKDLTSDIFGNLVEVREYNQGETYLSEYSYDANSNLTNITDAIGNERDFTYDLIGNKLSSNTIQKTADTHMYEYEYDILGRLITETKPDGAITSLTYDALSRVSTSENDDGITENIYDACVSGIGNLCSTTTPQGVGEAYSYHHNGLPASLTKTIDATAHTFAYTYDRSGLPLTTIYPNGTVQENIYDILGRPESVDLGTTILAEVTYTDVGLLDTLDLGNGIEKNYSYDPGNLDRLLNLYAEDTTGTILQDFIYEYDLRGNIIQIDDDSEIGTAKRTQYSYDDLSRLTESLVDLGSPGDIASTKSTSFFATSKGIRGLAKLLAIFKNSTKQSTTILASPEGGVTEETQEVVEVPEETQEPVVEEPEEGVTEEETPIIIESKTEEPTEEEQTPETIPQTEESNPEETLLPEESVEPQIEIPSDETFQSADLMVTSFGIQSILPQGEDNDLTLSYTYDGIGNIQSVNDNESYVYENSLTQLDDVAVDAVTNALEITGIGPDDVEVPPGDGGTTGTGNTVPVYSSGGGGGGGSRNKDKESTSTMPLDTFVPVTPSLSLGGGGGTISAKDFVETLKECNFITVFAVKGQENETAKEIHRGFTSCVVIKIITIIAGKSFALPSAGVSLGQSLILGAPSIGGECPNPDSASEEDCLTEEEQEVLEEVFAVPEEDPETPADSLEEPAEVVPGESEGEVIEEIQLEEETTETEVVEEVSEVDEELTEDTPEITEAVVVQESNSLATIQSLDTLEDIFTTEQQEAYTRFQNVTHIANPHATLARTGEDGLFLYIYDEMGNLTEQQQYARDLVVTTTHTYDANDRLIHSVLPDQSEITYLYDVGGQRVQKTTTTDEGTITTTYPSPSYTVKDTEVSITVSLGLNRVADVSYNSDATVEYEYILTDHLGSTHVVTDEGEVLVEVIDYLPFGNERTRQTQNEEGIDRTFTGHVLDRDSGLIYANARYYDGGLRRFTSVDPASQFNSSQFLSDPQQLNLYGYVRNNPIFFNDPTGENLYHGPYRVDTVLIPYAETNIGIHVSPYGTTNEDKQILVDRDFSNVLDRVNSYAKEEKVELRVFSDFRDESHNQSQGVSGASRSNHLIGNAVDFKIFYSEKLYSNSDFKTLFNTEDTSSPVFRFLLKIKEDTGIRGGDQVRYSNGTIDFDHLDSGANQENGDRFEVLLEKIRENKRKSSSN